MGVPAVLSKLLGRTSTANPKGLVDVGWLVQTTQASFIWDAPAHYRRKERPPDHAKSASYCPAVLDNERRLVEVNCPFDLRLRVRFDDKGEAVLQDANGIQSAMMPHAFAKIAKIAPRSEWRHTKRPIFQIRTPYVFLADTPVYMAQLPPFLDFRSPAWPGVVIGGRVPIHIWPRTLNWAFEWYDTTQDLVLTRGQAWFYCRFETQDPSRQIRLVEATLTPELRDYLAGIEGVVNYVNKTFSLFSTAQQRRPPKLLVAANRQKTWQPLHSTDPVHQ
jgi:hypothetical protein